MLRNLNKSAAGRRILGTPNVGLIASKILAETASGDHGPGLLYDEAQANPGKQLRLRITSLPGSGALTVNENGSFELVGAADGAYTIGYDWYADNLIGASDVATITVGTISSSAPGVTLTNTGTIIGGAALGGSSGDDTAPGASVTGTGSINAGAATGEHNAIAPGADVTGAASLSAGQATGDADASSSTLTLTAADLDAIVAAVIPAILAALNATTIPVDVKKVNSVTLAGAGVNGDPMRPA